MTYSKIKSPFLIKEQAISNKICDQILFDLQNFEDMTPLSEPHQISDDVVQDIILDYVPQWKEEIASYYGVIVSKVENIEFWNIPEGVEYKANCDNSKFYNNVWIRTSAVDFTSLIFLQNTADHTPLDPRYEIFGGRYEFPQYNFGFNPTTGVMITHPSDPHFINGFSTPIGTDLFVIKIKYSCNDLYLHDPKKFPGDITCWFNN